MGSPEGNQVGRLLQPRCRTSRCVYCCRICNPALTRVGHAGSANAKLGPLKLHDSHLRRRLPEQLHFITVSLPSLPCRLSRDFLELLFHHGGPAVCKIPRPPAFPAHLPHHKSVFLETQTAGVADCTPKCYQGAKDGPAIPASCPSSRRHYERSR